MGVLKLEHYLVLAHDIEVTRDFYCGPLGMRTGFRPDLGFPGYWIYVDTTACIHIAEWRTYTAHSERLRLPVTTPAPGTGAVDHLAFVADDYDSFVARLGQHGVTAHRLDTADGRLRQLFVTDPNGVKIELNFWQSAGMLVPQVARPSS